MAPTARWLNRHRAGDHDAVWHELRQLGAGERQPGLGDEAQGVRDERARRAGQNIAIVVERLTEQGFIFHANDDGQTPVASHYPPGRVAESVVDWLLSHFGAVPMTLLSWLRLVGDVWFVGTHPDWPESAAADPLVIELEGSKYPDVPIIDYFEAVFGSDHADGASERHGLLSCRSRPTGRTPVWTA